MRIKRPVWTDLKLSEMTAETVRDNTGHFVPVLGVIVSP